MDKIQELEFLQQNIPNMKVEYFDIILSVAERAYFKDDSGLGYSAIVGFILDALNHQKTSIEAINEIGHWDLLEDVTGDMPYNLKEQMKERIREKYGIEIYEDDPIPNCIEDIGEIELPCIFRDEGNGVVYTISVDDNNFVKESFNSMDEAIAFLTIDREGIDLLEAKLIEKTDNKSLEKKLIDKNYFGLKEEKNKIINDIRELQNQIGSFIKFGNKNLGNLSESKLELIYTRLKEIEKLRDTIESATTEKSKETINYEY